MPGAPAPVPRLKLTARQRASWLAHLFKAVFLQHHGELRLLLAPHVPLDAVVVDVGAHAGQFSKLFARMAPAGRIFAFEPSAYARSIMAPALRLNRIRNVTLLPSGLSDTPSEAVLHTPIKSSGSLGYGVAHLGTTDETAPHVDQHVKVITLDSFAEARALTRLDFLKADIEGWELRALKGGERTLRRFSPALFLEIDARWMARAGDTPEGLIAFLSDLGYRAVSAPGQASANVYTEPGDYLFVRADRL